MHVKSELEASTQSQLYHMLAAQTASPMKKGPPSFRLDAFDMHDKFFFSAEGAEPPPAPETDPSANQVQTSLRCCYTNEVKSAKDLKISMKGENPSFFPTIPYSLIKGGDDEKLDLRMKKPTNLSQGLGQNPNPLQVVDDGAEMLYNPDLDKWLLNNQMTFERCKLQ